MPGWARHRWGRIAGRLGLEAYYPHVPSGVRRSRLLAQAAGFFRFSPEAVRSHHRRYRALHRGKGYEAWLGERKTLCFEEAFLLYLAALRVRPSTVVEVGSQHGRSTRRILDLLDALGLGASVVCFDTAKELRFVSPDEVEFVQRDVTGRFVQDVLAPHAPGLIYLDAHPPALIRDVVSSFLAYSRTRPCVLAIHDCGPGLYNPRMTIRPEDAQAVTSLTGVWERHVLSELLAVPQRKLDDLALPHHRLRIFHTPHGLALIAPCRLVEAWASGPAGDPA